MGIKGDGQGRYAGSVGFGPEPRQQPLVAAVNSVEVADRDKRTSSLREKVTNVFDRDHRHFAPLHKPAAPFDGPVSH